MWVRGGIIIALLGGAVFGAAHLLSGLNFAVLNAKGPIGAQQRDLIIFASLLSLVIVIPVFALTFGIAWRYRAGNTKATYSPKLDGSRFAETLWWAIPSLLILILSVVTWISSHDLDPKEPVSNITPAMTIQVVALPWKWLFIYPEQGIATVNYLQMPVGVPVDFEITSDAPMNSFWIPQLGGQIYAMSGMATHLNLMASEAGDYRGSSANISGKGFSGMHFIAKAVPGPDFDAWVANVRQGKDVLNNASYAELAKPSENVPPAQFAAADTGLFDAVIAKYEAAGMHPGAHFRDDEVQQQ